MDRVALDIWDMHMKGHPICITTNGFVKANGECVMGRGNALEAKTRYPALPREVGARIRRGGNIPHYLYLYNMFTFPVKHVWNEAADLDLIARSALYLWGFMNGTPKLKYPVYLPSPGTGNGRLDWSQVEPVLDHVFAGDDRLVVVVKPGSVASKSSAVSAQVQVIDLGEL